MSTKTPGMRVVDNLIAIGAGVLVTSLMLLIVFAFSSEPKPDDTDPVDGLSGLRLAIDAGTGCHWFTTRLSFAAPVPRLGADGKQVCREEDRR